MQHLILLLLVCSIQLVGCQQLATVRETLFPTVEEEDSFSTHSQGSEHSDPEVQKLLRQKHIDPLTRYIEIYQNDKNKLNHVQLVRIERDKRCLQIARRYEQVEKTAKNLAQLRKDYNYSCPRVVSDFATATLIEKPENLEKQELPKRETLADAEVKRLLRQKYIDPLTQYIDKYENDSKKMEQVLVIKEERDKRCVKVKEEYAKKPKNQEQLARLKKGYEYSCPEVVKDFASLVPPIPEVATAVPPTSPSSPVDKTSLQVETEKALSACETALNKQDYTTAFSLCSPLAEQGNENIQYTLGLMYEEGKGVEKNATKAFQWFQKAADQNVSKAQLVIGRKYYTGEVVSRDLAKAAQWYRRAAEQGDAEAQYVLGIMYELGQGVPQDFVLAYQFFLLSAAQGHPAAITSRGEMDTKLAPEQIAEGQRLAREWSKTYTSK